MITYTPQFVERLLRSYLDIRCTLEGTGGQYKNETPVFVTDYVFRGEVPLGRTKSNPTWPFISKDHAPRVRDGKKQARSMEEIHCATLDIESAFPQLSDDDKWILYHYFIVQTITLDDIVSQYKLRGRAGARMRVQRALIRLARILETLYA